MKILGSDFDGTLNYNGIDDAKRQSIKKWRRAGNVFGVVSGRYIDDLLMLTEKHNFEYDFLIANNGAVVLKNENSNKTVIFESKCDGAIIASLIKHLFDMGSKYVVINAGFPAKTYRVCKNKADCFLPHHFTLENLPSIPYFNQMTMSLETNEMAEKVALSIEKKFGKVLNPLQNYTTVDIVGADVNKAKGIYRLVEYLGAKYDDVIVVGDNINDRHMIKEFRSYAMENGVEEIKKCANYTTVGVAQLIEKELI